MEETEQEAPVWAIFLAAAATAIVFMIFFLFLIGVLLRTFRWAYGA